MQTREKSASYSLADWQGNQRLKQAIWVLRIRIGLWDTLTNINYIARVHRNYNGISSSLQFSIVDRTLG